MRKTILSLLLTFIAASAWAFSSVTTLPQGKETKKGYMLITPRGALLADNSLSSSYVVSNLKFKSRTTSESDEAFQFVLYQSTDEKSGYYLYNVKTGKFVGQQSDTHVNLSDTPALWYIFKNNQSFTNKSNDVGGQFNSVDYPWCVSSIDGEINGGAIAVSEWQSETGTRTSGTSWDGGNHYQVVEAETVADNVWKDGYDKVVAYEAAHQAGANTFGGELDPSNVLDAATKAKQEAAALDIINRFTEGKMNVEVVLDLCRTTKDCDQYSYSATADVLTVHASSAVAACRGFYDYVKSKNAGFCSWSGSRFEKPADMACDEVNVVTQFRDHQYFNVVTYGYTAPFWGKERWRQELDWMAFHGVDMPLMLVGSEAIYRDVFVKDFGLTDADVDAWEVGPAHLPWFRMGNLSGTSFDGPLGQEWYENQRQLAHYLLDEMDKLGMKPVCPAFGGFVPQAFSKTGTTPETVGWNWCKPGQRNVPNFRLMPDDPKFVEVGKKFMERWEAEYGTGKYYLSDSFNEMSVPGSTSLLTQYGDNIFSIIKSSANPESVWVTQGWTFCYQYRDWGKTKFDALTQNVDGNRFIALYMSPEYAELYGHARDFDTAYQGFSGKGWNCTMLPNMGGKNFWTGNLNKYAKGYLNDLYNMADHGNIVGYGMTPEGVENNELLYELICDAGWTKPGKTIALDDWMTQYEQSRYGHLSAEMATFHNVVRSTLYNTYKDHPRFAWQAANIGITGSAAGGSVPAAFMTAVENLFNNAEALKAINTPLLEAELIEAAAMYVGTKIEKLTAEIKSKKSDRTECTRLISCLQELMLDFDAALELHPTWNLKRWEDMAQACGNKDAVRNAKNARRIVTVWFGDHTTDEPVQDYASRIWSGLMRDYYCPRLVYQLKADCGIETFNRIKFENDFVNKAPYLSNPRPVTGDHIDFLVKLINQAKNFGSMETEPVAEFKTSTDVENHWYALHPAANAENALTASDDNAVLTVAADMMESSQVWRIVATGTDTYRLESRFGYNATVVDGAAKSYLAPVNCNVRITKAGDKLFTITPVAGTATLFSGNWTITETPASLVAEAASIDYTHYVRRVAGFAQTAHFGKPGFPKSEEDQTAAIVALQKEAQNIDHKTYDTFLYQWADLYDQYFTPATEATEQLVNLIMSAHQIIVPADAEKGGAAATLFDAIKAAENAVAAGSDAAAATSTLEAAILAYYAAGGTVTTTAIEDIVPPTVSFPYTSPAPVNGQWDTETVAYYVKNDKDNGFWLSTAAAYCDGENLKVSNGTQPTDEAGRWVICGNDKVGYTFYNVAAGATKVLGITGTEGSARAKMYTIGETGNAKTAFKVSKNQSGFAFYFDTNNAWNNRSGYLALWEHANALTSDNGSRFVFVEAGKVVMSPEELELLNKFNELRETAQTKYDSNEGVTTEGENIITDPSWFSSNATETREGDITKLLDGDCTTYWHSNWATNVPAHTHYLQVTLPEAIEGDIQLTMGRRINKGNFCADDNPVEMSVEASANGTDFAEAIRFLTPFTQTVAQPYVKAVFTLDEPAKVLRFFNEKSNSSNQRGYWHCGEFQLNKVTYSEGVNDKFAEAAATFKEALSVADAVSTPTQSDYDTLLAAYNAYLAAIGGTEGIGTLGLNNDLGHGCYDLSGRRVSKAVRGLYIQNGHKVLR